MKRAGFVEMVETRTKWPMSEWSSDPKMKGLGRWNQLRITQGIERCAVRMLTTIGGGTSKMHDSLKLMLI
jgi:hypothetical protein